MIAQNIPLNHNPKTELGPVNCLVAKNILVFGPSPYQQRGFIIPSAMQMKIKDGDRGRVHALIRADEPTEYLGVRFVLKSEPFERLVSQIDKVMADFGDKASSSCAPGVFPCNSKTPWRDIRSGIIEAAQINSVQEYIGSQLSLGRVLPTSNELIGRCRETDSEEAQNNRKDGDEYRANRDNFFVVVVNKGSRLADATVEDSYRRGAIFFIGMICLAAFAAFYWWLIAR
jgi:hypothetical protein